LLELPAAHCAAAVLDGRFDAILSETREVKPESECERRIRAGQNSILAALALISPVAVSGIPKTRTGGAGDGGYVMLDDFAGVSGCYSIGIGPDVSWDIDMAERGLEVWQYDHTVPRAPAQHANFHFHKVGLTHETSPVPNMLRLETMLEQNGHLGASDLLLKIDVEGAEWEVFDTLDTATLARFRQILCEFHWFQHLATPEFRSRARRVFELLRRTHRVIHVHSNNFGKLASPGGVPIPEVLELTFVSSERYRFEPNRETFPTLLDRANHPERPDWFLGPFRFS
jgi:hypothetical protein